MRRREHGQPGGEGDHDVRGHVLRVLHERAHEEGARLGAREARGPRAHSAHRRRQAPRALRVGRRRAAPLDPREDGDAREPRLPQYGGRRAGAAERVPPVPQRREAAQVRRRGVLCAYIVRLHTMCYYCMYGCNVQSYSISVALHMR